MQPETIALILTTMGVTAIVPMIYKGLVGYFTGRQRREREAWLTADQEARARREWEIYAHRLHRVAVQQGIPTHMLPTPPGHASPPQHMPTPSSIIEPPRPKE